MNNNKNTIIIILIVIVAILIIALAGAIVYIVINQDNNSTNNRTIVNAYNQNISNNDNDNISEQTEKELAVQVFNAKFTQYEMEDASARKVRNLFDAIDENNSTDSEHIVELNEEGITDVDDLNSSTTYNVEISSYDDDGYINEIIITESSDESGNDDEGNSNQILESMEFNSKFTSYLGSISGEQLKELLKIIQTNNTTNTEHIVNLTSNNMQDLKGIIATNMYLITATYDVDNYINNINIDQL